MIEIQNLSIRLNEFSLENLNLTIQGKEYFVILGPSGAGKTVFIECIAGLHKIKKGSIKIDGREITHLTPEERKIGYVPQDYVLFPFLNVRENIAFGLKKSRYRNIEIQRTVLALADLLGITHLLERDTRSLSGGEKQRVALARALAPGPKILLLDEPLSSLDNQTSRYLRLELRRMHQELGVTTIHITHNHAEAEELGDRIAIMCSGKIIQTGKPHEIFFSPDNPIVSDFTGSLNILPCNSCRQLVPGLMEVDCDGLRIVIPHDEGNMEKIAISPRDVQISPALPPGPSINRFKGIITDILYNTTTAIITIKIAGIHIMAEMPAELSREMSLTIGEEVYVILKLRRLKVLKRPAEETRGEFRWYYQEIL